MTPSLCGGFLTDKRSMVAFTWSITTVLTLFAFITAVILTIQVHTHYRRLNNYYEGDDWYQNNDDDDNNDDYYNNNNNNQDGEDGDNPSHDEQYQEIREAYQLLSSMSAKSITFVAVYTMMLATALSLYGSMAIVGFTSLRGVYIAPCFSSGGNKLRVGIFGGAIVIFANLLLVCAVVLGEVKVADYNNNNNDRNEEEQEGEREPYQVERIATILAVTCMFLSSLYTIFAVLLFLCHAGEEKSLLRLGDGDGVHHNGTGVGVSHNQTPLVSMTNTRTPGMGERPPTYPTTELTTALGESPGFITMDNSSQGTNE